MKRNVGNVDRWVRILLAIAIVAMIIGDVLSGTLAIILGVVAALLLLTSAMGFCPVYFPFKISTHKETKAV